MNLLWSQVILVAAMLAYGIYVFRFRTVLTDRIVLMSLAFAGIILVIDPEISTWLAHRIGIGRGADLIMYIFLVFCLFRFVGIASQSNAVERQMTRIIRAMAIDNARDFRVGSRRSAAGRTRKGQARKRQIRTRVSSTSASKGPKSR
jgi:small membrane protein